MVSPATSDDEWDGPCSCCNMTKCCKCGLEADETESNDNYRRRYIRCPKRVSVQRCCVKNIFGIIHFTYAASIIGCLCCLKDEIACDFFEFVDPEYTPRSMQVIDDLVLGQMDARDAFLTDRNERHWAAEDEGRVEDALCVEVWQVTKMFHVGVTIIGVLLAIIVLSWIR